MISKLLQREKAYKVRNEQKDKDKVSDLICHRFIDQKVYQLANTVMWYVHCRSEVRTINALAIQLKQTKKIVIPYCTTDLKGQRKLGLWWLQDVSELVLGKWNILEPPKSRWNDPVKQVSEKELDLIMVPGVAFDLNGGRLGNGAGYYDRLLQTVRKETVLTAICFESQLCDKVIMEPHDVTMDFVITENECYRTV